ncbi:MAG: YraN family protein [Candidatus Marinimicrobia bacterium]|nr:YraN family protein [Candidatus Neomarinimicrobiota bacterium]
MSWLSRWVRRGFRPDVIDHPRAEPAHLRLGRWGEDQAARFLTQRGYRILERNLRLGRRSELDLVAARKGVLVFVEVKTVRRTGPVRPAARINRRKKQALARAVDGYLRRLRTMPRAIQCDVIEVIGAPEGPPPEIRHLEAPFRLEGHRHWQWAAGELH